MYWLAVSASLLAFGGGPESDAWSVVTAAKKSVSIRQPRFLHGVRSLPWLTPAVAAKDQQIFLEFREENSTTFEQGILTLVPVRSLRSLSYDSAKKTVLAKVLAAGDKEFELHGPTKYVNLNKLIFEGTVDVEAAGKATVKFSAGPGKDGIQSVAFGKAVATPHVKGEASLIVAKNKEKSVHTAYGVTAIYRLPKAGFREHAKLHFLATASFSLDHILSLKQEAAGMKGNLDFTVSLRDGNALTLSLNPRPSIDGEKGQLVGLFGQTETGYKLFPLHTVAEWRRADRK